MRATFKVLRVMGAAVALAVLAGCASSMRLAHQQGACAYDAPSQTLTVTGSIDADLAACIRSRASEDVAVMRLNTVGGQVEAALDAAEVIARWRPHMVVAGQCSSSCANYWLPVAERITLEPRAAVILHGSIDQGFVDRAPPERRAALQATADRQAAFAEIHGVPPGWLMTRSRENYEAGRIGPHLTGAPTGNGPLFGRIEYLLVEEPLMRSCLSGPQIDPFEDSAPQRARARLLSRVVMAWQGVGLSGSLACA